MNSSLASMRYECAPEEVLLRAYKTQSATNQKTFDYKHNRRQNMRKAMRRVFFKVKNQVRDGHHR
jgi:hypothetical protein